MTVIDGREFRPPGKGPWGLEATHFQRPFSLFTGAAAIQGMPPGFAQGTARYGIMLSHFKLAQVHGFMYMQAVAFGAPEGAAGPPPKLVLQLLTRLHPAIRRRLRAGADAVERKAWHEDLRRWDEEVKPAAAALQGRRQAVVLASLDDEALAVHIESLWKDLAQYLEIRHSFTFPAIMPVGDFMAHVSEWTGRPTGEILAVLRGSSPVSAGIARAELATLAEAMRGDGVAMDLVRSSRPPAEVVSALCELAGATGEAMRAYVALVGVRSLGYDIGEGTALDYPEVLVRAIRAALEPRAVENDRLSERVATLRGQVPAQHRDRFDELFGEARHLNRLRDERGNYTDSWITGLARRAILEAGRRLAARGRLDRAELLLDASLPEILAILRGGAGAGSAELAARASWRTTRSIADVPPWLGAPPSGPPPAAWLPVHARRAARAADAFIGALFDTPAARATARGVEGLAVSEGSYEGRARLVLGPDDFNKVEKGDILVARTTGPTFNVLLPLLGGIVTDRGGQLSHAAVVAREYGIPAVVGTTTATQLFRDGEQLRIDGDRGRVEVVA